MTCDETGQWFDDNGEEISTAEAEEEMAYQRAFQSARADYDSEHRKDEPDDYYCASDDAHNIEYWERKEN